MKGPFLVLFEKSKKVIDGFKTLKDAQKYAHDNQKQSSDILTALSLSEYKLQESKNIKKSTLISIIKEVLQETQLLTEEKILIPRRTPEERRKNFIIATQRKIQQYIKNGSKGDLNLSNTPITSLPDSLKQVGGSLDLRNTSITSLPDNLTRVGGWLSLYNTPITKLPDNLTVGGDLNLGNTPITTLPDNLTQVGGWLILYNTSITKLPDNLKVGGSLNLENTSITSLPDNLTVNGSLNLENTPITKLPDNLTVGGWLDFSNTKITTIPASAKIKGKIYGLKNENIMKKEELKEIIISLVQEILKEEAGLTRKFDSVLTRYKELMLQKQNLVKEFIKTVKANTNVKEVNKIKEIYLKKLKVINAKLEDYEEKFSQEVQNLSDPNEEELI
jgi:hypothetical protein